MRYAMLIIVLLLSACSRNQPWQTQPDQYLQESYYASDNIFNSPTDRTSYMNHFEIIVWNVVDSLNPVYAPDTKIKEMLDELNRVYKVANIQFEIREVNELTEYYTYESLVANDFSNYYNYLINYNTANVIDLYLVDHEPSLCYNDGRVRGCAKGRGFTNTGGWLSSIVIPKEDVANKKIPVHEFGHFFNLEHTHFNYKEQIAGLDCEKTGDQICDTPPDPGAGAYGAMVNYTDCEMYGAFDENGVAYKPMINNFMSYYAPCYMMEYKFTKEQINRMKNFALDAKRMEFVKSSL